LREQMRNLAKTLTHYYKENKENKENNPLTN
jgi:hypothetical protein